jgi:hypothetical protein
MITIDKALVVVPHEYNTPMGRRIQSMKMEALSKAVGPIIDEFFRMFKEFGEGEAVENFECLICRDDYSDHSAKDRVDLYDLACQLEDLGSEFCSNYIGIKIKRIGAEALQITFAKRTDTADHYTKLVEV